MIIEHQKLNEMEDMRPLWMFIVFTIVQVTLTQSPSFQYWKYLQSASKYKYTSLGMLLIIHQLFQHNVEFVIFLQTLVKTY